jgi:transmembrane sensor
LSFPCLNNKKKEDRMEKEEKDIRFVARFYRGNRLDTTQAWQKLGIGKQRNNSILLYRLITIAAVTFLIAGFSWWWIYDRQDWIVIASSAHAVKEVTLPDNSHITLAENSALQYDRLAYGKKNRNVTLNGKAYFSVTHQEQCPFRVQTELANIQVLGTQFQVTANANQTSATVESGKVRFYNKEQKEAILTKGMYAFINQKGQMQIEKQSDPNTFAWKTHVFVYNEAPLKKVVKELEEVYKVHIGGIPQKEYYLTTTFDNTPIEDIIEIINQTLDTKLDITQ